MKVSHHRMTGERFIHTTTLNEQIKTNVSKLVSQVETTNPTLTNLETGNLSVMSSVLL